MTKEEILAMEPGPELDTLVAEKVMGHPMPDFIPEDALDLYLVGTPIHYDSWTCVCRYDEGDAPKWVADPYSTDISAAWPVVEKLGDVFVDLCRVSDKSWKATVIVGQVPKLGGPMFDEAEGETAPEAICKAALIVFVGK